MRILIAEDDQSSALVLAAALHRLGHEVITARDGRIAWEIFQRESIRVVITDWMMPEVDGPELCGLIRSEGRAAYTWIILLTALGDRGSYLKGMSAGADDFIAKPFDLEMLGMRLRVAERVLQLQAHVKQLEGLLPVCSYCKKIRDEADRWTMMEEYVMRHSAASFSHSVCPECYKEHVRPQLDRLEEPRDEERTGT